MKVTTVKQISDLLKELNVPHKVEDNILKLHDYEIEDYSYSPLLCISGNCIFHIDYFELNHNKDILLGYTSDTLCVNLFLAEIEGQQ